MNNRNLFFTAAIASLVLFSSCEKEDPIIPNEEELITTLNYTLTPTQGGKSIVLSFVDLDGDGGNPPVITGGTLVKNQTYTGSVGVFNESENPKDDITQEIAKEDKEHQLFFQTNISGLSIKYNDVDGNGNPIGLITNATTGAAGSGILTIILRHLPNKFAAGVASGNITNAGGETDIEVNFPISVQ